MQWKITPIVINRRCSSLNLDQPQNLFSVPPTPQKKRRKRRKLNSTRQTCANARRKNTYESSKINTKPPPKTNKQTKKKNGTHKSTRGTTPSDRIKISQLFLSLSLVSLVYFSFVMHRLVFCFGL